MTADQAQAAPTLLDLDLAAIAIASVPDVLSPIDGIAGAEASLNPGPDRVAAPRLPSREHETPWPPRQFAVLLTEALAGLRPLQHVLPWMSERGTIQLRRLLPLFCGEHRPRILRVLTASPNPGVIEMTIVVAAGPRARALAVRLERAASAGRPAFAGQTARRGKPPTPWLCTDIEAA
jgi:hypothetical protein